jgi:2,4-dienoyl-CoA reductase-like NADH-dependent reductase (Old Yellow Enzyme family)
MPEVTQERPSACSGSKEIAVPGTPAQTNPRPAASEATAAAFAPGTLGPVALRNRIIKAATFEGMSHKGLVSDQLIDFHRSFAAGGVAMTTVAYCAVSREGQGAPHEIVLRPEALPGLRKLAEAVHAEGAAVSAQIGHAGPVGSPRVTRTKALAASSGFSPLGTRYHEMTEADIARVTDDFASGAKVLVEAGFDAIEIHLAHHYLLNSFLSPRFNKRKDTWGGDIEGRSRFPRQVVRAVRDAVGDKVAVTAKFPMVDGVPRGLWLAESVQAARLLQEDGALDALQLTGGGSLANPMYLFRGEVPREEFAATLPQPVRLGYRIIGRRFMPDYPFEEAYFLSYARQFRDALTMPLILLGGINKLETIESALAEGFPFVAMGRALLREPDLPLRMQEGKTAESLCVHCNKCMPTIYSGTHCVLVPAPERPGLRIVSAG